MGKEPHLLDLLRWAHVEHHPALARGELDGLLGAHGADAALAHLEGANHQVQLDTGVHRRLDLDGPEALTRVFNGQRVSAMRKDRQAADRSRVG